MPRVASRSPRRDPGGQLRTFARTLRTSGLVVVIVTLFALVPVATAGPVGAGAKAPANADPKGVARYGVNFVNFLFQDNFNPPQSISVDAEYVFFDYLYDTLLDQNTAGTKVIPRSRRELHGRGPEHAGAQAAQGPHVQQRRPAHVGRGEGQRRVREADLARGHPTDEDVGQPHRGADARSADRAVRDVEARGVLAARTSSPACPE